MPENELPVTGQSESPAQGNAAPVQEKKARKPREKKAATPVREPIRLPAVTLLDGVKDDSILSTIGKKYAMIQIYTADGKKLHTTVHSNVKEVPSGNIGIHMLNWFFCLVNAVLAGQGQSPDASAVYIAKNTDTVVKYWGKDFLNYRLVVTPEGRSGASKYEASLAQFVSAATAKAVIVGESVKKHGQAKHQTVVRKTADEPAPTIQF